MHEVFFKTCASGHETQKIQNTPQESDPCLFTTRLEGVCLDESALHCWLCHVSKAVSFYALGAQTFGQAFKLASKREGIFSIRVIWHGFPPKSGTGQVRASVDTTLHVPNDAYCESVQQRVDRRVDIEFLVAFVFQIP